MKKSIFWFRRDLRLHDNHGLYQALSQNQSIQPLFIFDELIIDELEKDDPRLSFIHDQVHLLKRQLEEQGSDIIVRYGRPFDLWRELLKEEDIHAVYTNHDYEPYAIARDKKISTLLSQNGIDFHSYKDHVIFEKDEIKTASDGIYTVFTPYKKKWLDQFSKEYIPNFQNDDSLYPSEKMLHKLVKNSPKAMLDLGEFGFTKSMMQFPEKSVSQNVIKDYAARRDYPEIEDGTSRLGIHFRFGTVSIREKARKAWNLSEVFLSELIWRDFYAQIMANFPHVITNAFRSKYDQIPWRTDNHEFDLWSNGMTGYPIVDAGMRQLNETGYMHNRVRMITASFLTKHLLMDWRIGEAYFASKLLDYDLASNNGGWQWAAGSGTDAAPYFRIFNPTSQMDKFDKNRIYIKRWVPEYGTSNYPKPMVEHKFARERCLETYKTALANN